MKLKEGDTIPVFTINDVMDSEIVIQKFLGKKLYLTFLRNTACPLCSYHVFSLLKILKILKDKNVEVIIFYESRKEVILSSSFFKEQVLSESQVRVVSDTARKVYNLFGAEIDAKKATFTILQKHGRMTTVESASQEGFHGDGLQEGTNPDAVPADFLINEKGIVFLAHYGADAGDNLSLETVLNFTNLGSD